MSSVTAFPDADGFTQSFTLDDVEGLKKFFEEHGFVVVRDLIDSRSQIEQTIDEIWNFLRACNPKIDRTDPSTWEDKYWPVFFELKAGTVLTGISLHRSFDLIELGGFISPAADVSLKMSWENRQHPNVVRLFQILLEREDLWVKFDRYGMMRPTQGIPMKSDDGSMVLVNRPEWQSKSNW